MNGPLRVGVMGLASIARRRLLPALAACPETRLVCVASRDQAAAWKTAAHLGCQAVADYDALLARPDIEAVYVPLPAALHARWVRRALEAGKHVLAEKPLTTDADTTRELLALARARRLVLQENVMFVHHAQHVAVRRLLAEGAIGEVRAVHAAFTVPRPPDGDIRHSAELGGGALGDMGVYPVRAALHLLGGALEVAGAVFTRSRGSEVEVGGTALLHIPEGAVATCAFGMEDSYRSRYEVWGSRGSIRVEHAFTPPAGHPPVLRVERGQDVEELTLPPDDQVVNTVAAFATAVRAGRPAPGEAATLRQAELLDDIRLEATKRRSP
ncbi:Gfo/Idh/MocA family oxidoreductase [Streptomyces europaeiscabiei]|uniref:Gfo/Idh/MocA family protein n=1 Tax=Streptomyces europaeiscabiei TaxID=146819 RepID=UPI0029A80610|nr:Gfo/Idh/MocA family oxidoreductase [Streptomyces europaeiscabiei]MDX3691352.1 Gfo/Idh/MocA family oxidoreductase [Streptomyces europaeiscabiei]